MRISDWSSDVCSSDLTDDAQAVDLGADLDRLRRNHAVLADDIDDLARLVGLHRGGGDQQRARRLACRQPHVAEHAGGQEHLGIVEAAAGADRARAWVEAVVGEVDPALPRSEEHTSELQYLMRHSYAV